MLRSMTGFGSAAGREDGVSLQVEIRTVNNKFYKSSIRLPEPLQSLEAELDTYISRQFSRGSVSVSVKFVDTSELGAATINIAALDSYIKQLKQLDESLSIDASRLLLLPGVMTNDSSEEVVTRVRPMLQTLLTDACKSAIDMRDREGQILEQDLDKQLLKIDEHLSHIKERAPEIVVDYQNRLRQRMEGLLAEIGKRVAEEDMLREVAIFAERTDIAEEISRLSGHLEQFRELVAGDANEPIGRTLDFLAQEMLRESNTIGSKCLDGETSRRIVEIKGAIDRIKEQVQNAE